MNVRTFLTAGVLVAVVLSTGCSDGKKEKPVYKVHGRVTFDGKPVAKGAVSFYPVDPSDRNTPSHATTDDDGNFVMHTYRDGDGVPVGEHIVTLYWPGPRVKKEKGADPDERESVAPDRLKGEYAQVGKSKLRATVREQDNEINFKLP